MKYAPQLFCNLISLTSVLNKGSKLNGDQDGMTIRKANTEYMFNQRIKSGDRELAGIHIEILDAETAGVRKGYTHVILGHPCVHITKMTAKYLHLNTRHHEEICESYVNKCHKKGRI